MSEREELYMAALNYYGGELQKELCKYLRKKDTQNKIELIPSIAEEIADVEIMLEQMKLLFEIENAVEKFKAMNVNRLRERLK